jgi:hypothetical protein
MKTKRTTVTRRDFIKGTVGATISAGLLGSGLLKGARIEGSLSSVIIVRDQNVMDSSMIVDKNILNNMLDQILIKLTGKKNAKDAWLSMISPSDVIGLVPTPLMNPTHEELIEVVTESLTAAGVPEGNIRNAQGRSVDLEPITALISMPGLKAHWLTGIGTVIKNYILYSGAPRKYHYQDSAKLGEIWNLPQVKGKPS